MANCIHCNAEIAEGSAFCSACGKKQVKSYSQTFRREKMSEAEFIKQINSWFAKYPQVGNVKGKFLTRSAPGLMVNKYVLDAFSIEYELLDGNNTNQYALVSLENYGLVKKGSASVLDQWKQKNPGAIVVSQSGGSHSRGSTSSLMLGGLGATNHTQVYVFFKFNRKLGPTVPKE